MKSLLLLFNNQLKTNVFLSYQIKDKLDLFECIITLEYIDSKRMIKLFEETNV